MRTRAIAAAVVAAVALVAAGCGGSDGPAATADVPFDRAFIDAMVPHHQQAIEMAREAKAAGLSEPALVKVADAIIATQQGEIDELTGWRGEWFGSSEIDPAGAEALGMPMEEMGMSSAMDFSKEADVDAAFASAMIEHHNGAIAMATLAKERAQREEIRALAGDIIAAQEAEVAVMRPFAAGHSMAGMDG